VICFLGVGAALAQTVQLSPEEYEQMFGSNKPVKVDRALLEKMYEEFAFSPKYKNGRICKVRLERASYNEYDKIRDIEEVLSDEPPKLVVAGMIGDKCRFTSGDPTVWGNAKMAVEGQETFLKADKITYERNKQIVDAVGNVKIYKEGKMMTGSQFRFNLDSPQYLLDTDKTKVLYVEVKKRGDSRFRQDP
jgi:hypothetical protein